METTIDPTILVAIVGGIAGILGGALTHFTTMRTTERKSDTDVSIKQLEAENAIELAREKQNHEIGLAKEKQRHEIAFSQQTLAREIIQGTLEKGTTEEQARNLRAYARMGLIGEPYAKAILSMEASELPTVGAMERILSDPGGNLPMSYFDRLRAAARAVGLVTTGGQGISTGFLIAPGVMVTAAHVIGNPQYASLSAIEMDYEFGADGAAKPKEAFVLAPNNLFLTNRITDRAGYALVAVADRSQTGARIEDYGYIGASRTAPKPEDRINLIHHPEAGPKMAAIRGGRIVGTESMALHYHAASAPGSSGAPVLDEHFDVVAVHVGKIPKTDAGGAFLSRDGTPMPGKLDISRVAWDACDGLLWSAVQEDLRRRASKLTEAQRELLAPVLDLDLE